MIPSGFAIGPLGWHTSALTTELQEVSKFPRPKYLSTNLQLFSMQTPLDATVLGSNDDEGNYDATIDRNKGALTLGGVSNCLQAVGVECICHIIR